jgi:hypothetical protein
MVGTNKSKSYRILTRKNDRPALENAVLARSGSYLWIPSMFNRPEVDSPPAVVASTLGKRLDAKYFR